MPAIFGDHMVLQRDATVPVWGTAAAGEKITVALGNRTGSAVAGADGKWRVNLPPGPKDDAAQILTVAGTNTLSFQDVLVGDVWIASGQSNLEFGIQSDSRGEEAIKTANDPELRLFFVPVATALEPQADMKLGPHDTSLNGKWQVCTPELLASKWAWNGFSAVGYYFARETRRVTGAPVGMIETTKGGTPAQAWVSLDGLGKDPALAHYLADHQALVAAYPATLESLPKKQADFEAAMKQWNAENGKEYQAQLKAWDAAVAQAHADGQIAPPRPTPAKKMPAPPASPDGGSGKPANLYNAMVAPLVPYAVKGAIWYQGESNGDRIADAVEYNTLFPRLITDWRAKWGEGNFPFLYVQLANNRTPAKTPSEGVWAWVREAQLRTLAVPNTGMASAIDIGDPANIHPKDKLDVGLRLALAERHVALGENLVYSGPIYDASKVEGNKIRLTFKQRESGLMMGVPPWTPTGRPPLPPTKLVGFGIAGADQKFVWADAVVDGDSVLVSSPEVTQPVAVRYDWADCPAGNLYNKEGLPASPFRTDNWPAPATVIPTPSRPAPASAAGK